MGYQVVEFYAPYLAWTPETAKDVRKVLDDNGLKCHSTHNSGPWTAPDTLKKAIELNQILGSKTIVMASPGRVASQDDWKKGRDRQKGVGTRIFIETAQNVDSLAVRAKESGVTLASEVHDTPWGTRAFEVTEPSGFMLTISSETPAAT